MVTLTCVCQCGSVAHALVRDRLLRLFRGLAAWQLMMVAMRLGTANVRLGQWKAFKQLEECCDNELQACVCAAQLCVRVCRMLILVPSSQEALARGNLEAAVEEEEAVLSNPVGRAPPEVYTEHAPRFPHTGKEMKPPRLDAQSVPDETAFWGHWTGTPHSSPSIGISSRLSPPIHAGEDLGEVGWDRDSLSPPRHNIAGAMLQEWKARYLTGASPTTQARFGAVRRAAHALQASSAPVGTGREALRQGVGQGANGPDAALEHLFDRMDVNKDGVVDRREFMAAYAGRLLAAQGPL